MIYTAIIWAGGLWIGWQIGEAFRKRQWLLFGSVLALGAALIAMDLQPTAAPIKAQDGDAVAYRLEAPTHYLLPPSACVTSIATTGATGMAVYTPCYFTTGGTK